MLLYINNAKYSLSDANIKRAMAFAIPYEDLISKAYYNYSIRASISLIIPTTPAAKYIKRDISQEVLVLLRP